MQKRVLSLVIFLLTLFPLLGMMDGSTIMAQHWTYEDGSNWLPDLEVGSSNERCDECGHFYDPAEDHECRFKCQYCGEEVSELNRHYKYSQACAIAAGYKEEEDEACSICGLPKNECMCYLPGDSGDSGGTNGGGVTGSGTGSSSAVGAFPPSPVRHISVAELKIKPGV